jgi:hypothetical protein
MIELGKEAVVVGVAVLVRASPDTNLTKGGCAAARMGTNRNGN